MTKSILCIGELLIDFFTVEKGVSLQQALHYEKQAGGAPANVCCAITKLDGQASFCGKVGDDAFGLFLEQVLTEAKVNTELLLKDKNYPTTLAFVSRQSDGERDFIFNRGADAQVEIEELNTSQLVYEMVHFGSATALISDPFASTYNQLLTQFKQCAAFISFDPNYRANLWNGKTAQFVEKCVPFLSTADFVKMSEEELALFSTAHKIEEQVKEVYTYGMRWLLITLGARGTLFYDGVKMERVPSITVQMVDSTGAGDAFVGAMLVQLSKAEDIQMLSYLEVVEMIKRANKVGAKVCQKVGAIDALPTWNELD